MNQVVFMVGLIGPLVVYCVPITRDLVVSLLGVRDDYEDVDELEANSTRMRVWMVASFWGCVLAISDVAVAAIGLHAPLEILARLALGGAMAGVLLSRLFMIGNGAMLMIVGRVWPVGLAFVYAIHIGALWIVIHAI